MRFNDDTTPFVSVVIPVYNREETIGRAVRSVLDQSYRNFELIIVDDCSRDRSLQVIQEFQDERIKVISLQQNCGANAARNRGIMESQGQYVAFQDSDDEWDKDKLQLQMKDMLNRDLTVSFCAHCVIEGISRMIIPKDYENREKYEIGLIDVLTERNVVSTQTLIIRKDIFEKIGCFDEDMPRLQDYEFVIRLAQTEKIGYVAKPLVTVYRTAKSISTDNRALYKALALLLLKHGKFLNFNSFLSAFLDIAIAEESGNSIYKDCVQLQSALLKKGVDADVLTYAQEYIARKWRIANHIQKKLFENQMENLETNDFAIYGTGDIAHKIYRRLAHEEIYPKCFLVTRDRKEEQIGGIPVYTVEEWSDTEILVIVGTASVLQNEIVDTLLEKRYKHIICYPYL